MSKLLHNPTMKDLLKMIKSSKKVSRQSETRRIKDLPEIKSGLGFDGVEKLHMSNYAESLSKFIWQDILDQY